jgi:hypothetical protein
MKGARRKDMVYGNGQSLIRQLENISHTPNGLPTLQKYAKVKYGTKLAFQDVESIDNILKGIGNLDELQVDFPIFVGRILYHKLFVTPHLTFQEIHANDPRTPITQKTITPQQEKLLTQMLTSIQEQ